MSGVHKHLAVYCVTRSKYEHRGANIYGLAVELFFFLLSQLYSVKWVHWKGKDVILVKPPFFYCLSVWTLTLRWSCWFFICGKISKIFFFVCVGESDHELRGAVGRAGVCAGEGAVPRPEPGDALRLHRCYRGASSRRLPALLAFPRPLRQDGCAALARETGEQLMILAFYFTFVAIICMYGNDFKSHEKHSGWWRLGAGLAFPTFLLLRKWTKRNHGISFPMKSIVNVL